ncbi:hypothetical protein EP51_27200 [Rhodococcus opacus]|uniref:Uncharacterized protein n=1 Tax=Rhodococcus opacus TaxID=37919 RepID=A0A076ESA7_RHOOP|nr:hypothetical protein EP51_27200 [Rhodococcus opacus]
MVAGSIVAAAAPNFTVFLVGRALQGLTHGIVPVTIARARRYLRDKNMRYGISSESVTVANGLGDGYPLTGILGDLLGLRFALWFAALFTRLTLDAPACAAVSVALVTNRVTAPRPRGHWTVNRCGNRGSTRDLGTTTPIPRTPVCGS